MGIIATIKRKAEQFEKERREIELHCRKCDENISRKAERCPHCTYEPSKNDLSKGAAVASLGFGNVLTSAAFAHHAWKKGKEQEGGLYRVVKVEG